MTTARAEAPELNPVLSAALLETEPAELSVLALMSRAIDNGSPCSLEVKYDGDRVTWTLSDDSLGRSRRPDPLRQIVCTRCGNRATFDSDRESREASVTSLARMRGWRVWDGETISGEQGSHRLCPHCVDGTSDDWRAVCDTCGATMADDYDDDDVERARPYTEQDAERWSRNHDCHIEPSASVIRPSVWSQS